MTEHGSPFGRPRQADLEHAREENERAEMEHMLRQEAVAHQFEKLFAKLGSSDPQTAEYAQMMQTLMTLSAGTFRPPHPELSLEQMTGQFIRERAAANPGLYIHHGPGCVEIYDFVGLIRGAEQINYHPAGKDGNDGACIEIWRGAENHILGGEVAEALLGFLHFTGVFLVELAKRPCPECGDGPPRDCATCGGLGWIIPNEERTEALLREGHSGEHDCGTADEAQAVWDASVKTWPAPARGAVDDPLSAPLRIPAEAQAHAPKFEELTREEAKRAMNSLFEANLRAVSILQSILRWCEAVEGENASGAIEQIQALAQSALEP